MFLNHKQDNMKTNIPDVLKGFILQSWEQLWANSAGRNSFFGKKDESWDLFKNILSDTKKSH